MPVALEQIDLAGVTVDSSVGVGALASAVETRMSLVTPVLLLSRSSLTPSHCYRAGVTHMASLMRRSAAAVIQAGSRIARLGLTGLAFDFSNVGHGVCGVRTKHRSLRPRRDSDWEVANASELSVGLLQT